MYPLKQSTALEFDFFAFDANGDGVTGIVDGSWTKRIKKSGGAWGAMSVTITEGENGWYTATLSSSHTDTLGVLSVSLSASGAKRVNMQFRIHARVPDDLAYPTTSGRSIDVTTGGEVGIDWANVGTPGATVNLSATTLNLVNTLTTYTGNTPQTGDSFARIGLAGAGLTAIPWNAAWDAEVQSECEDALVVKNLDHLLAAAVTNSDVADNSVFAQIVSKSAIASWSSYINTTQSLEAAHSQRDTMQTSLSAISGYIDTEVAAIKAKTDNLPANPAATTDIPTVPQIWTTALAEAYRATGAAPTAAQALFEILQNITEFAINSTTKTVKKLDGSTTAKTYTLDSATAPTSITEAT
jgi:hypothetical protein